MHKKPTISSRSNLWQNSSATKGLTRIKVADTKINDIHDFTIFEKRRYLVAAFAVSLACAVLRYRLLKVSSVNYLPSRSYRTDLSSSSMRVAC